MDHGNYSDPFALFASERGSRWILSDFSLRN